MKAGESLCGGVLLIPEEQRGCRMNRGLMFPFTARSASPSGADGVQTEGGGTHVAPSYQTEPGRLC